MPRRDDFKISVKRTLAQRVGYVCSNPDCRSATSGPHANPIKSVIVGIAAHITAASPGGPRYNANLTEEQRKSPENGIWLCARCASLIDSDEVTFTTDQLIEWKRQAENDQFIKVTAGIPQHDHTVDENERLILLRNLMERSGAGFQSVLEPDHFESTIRDTHQGYTPKTYQNLGASNLKAARGTAGFRIFSVRRSQDIKILDLIGGISRNRISIVSERTGKIQLVVLDSQGNRSSVSYIPKWGSVAEIVCLTWDGNIVSLWWEGSKVSQLTLPHKIDGRWLALVSGPDIDGENNASYIMKGAQGGGGIGLGLCASDKSLQLIISHLFILKEVLSEEEIRTMVEINAAEISSNLSQEPS